MVTAGPSRYRVTRWRLKSGNSGTIPQVVIALEWEGGGDLDGSSRCRWRLKTERREGELKKSSAARDLTKKLITRTEILNATGCIFFLSSPQLFYAGRNKSAVRDSSWSTTNNSFSSTTLSIMFTANV